MRVGIIGCGYVADFYMQTCKNYPEIEIAGVFDINPNRLDVFTKFYGLKKCSSADEIWHDKDIGIVVNLTNPESHFEVSRQALWANKNVYTEKPMAIQLGHAEELAVLAKERGLKIASAPCSVLGETAQTIWRALRDRQIGNAKLVYAELDDDMMHRSHYRRLRSASGAPFPGPDEFKVGCTMEHAGYYLTWLCTFFGPINRVIAFAKVLFEDKQTDVPIPIMGPDFTVGCLQFESGVVARLTNSVVAPYNHELKIVGETGSISVQECWDYGAKVFLERDSRFHRALRRRFGVSLKNKVPLVRKPTFKRYSPAHRMDFMRGIQELLDSINEERDCRLGTDFSLHVTEVSIALQYPREDNPVTEIKSHFTPREPTLWAV